MSRRADAFCPVNTEAGSPGREDLPPAITVKLDPRLQVTTAELREQLAQKLAAGMNATYEGYNAAAKLHTELADRAEKLSSVPDAQKQAQTAAAAARELKDYAGLGPLNRDLTRLLIAVDQADTLLAQSLLENFTSMCTETKDAVGKLTTCGWAWRSRRAVWRRSNWLGDGAGGGDGIRIAGSKNYRRDAEAQESNEQDFESAEVAEVYALRSGLGSHGRLVGNLSYFAGIFTAWRHRLASF